MPPSGSEVFATGSRRTRDAMRGGVTASNSEGGSTLPPEGGSFGGGATARSASAAARRCRSASISSGSALPTRT
jgi:hypothetical protein